jgi:peptidoglycan/LPS O-acetylase OafA/YrhL
MLPLLSVQFAAVAWIVINQFRGHLDLHLGERAGFVDKGYIGAGLYLVAFGFLATRFYERAAAQNRLRYPALVLRAFRSLFPIHLAAFVLLILLLGLGRLARVTLTSGNFPFDEGIGQLLMVQAWGLVRHDSWNFPSWLVSAVWAGFLLLPIVVQLGRRLGGGRLIIVAYALFFVLFAYTAHVGFLLTDLTTFGVVQMIPAMLLGAGIYYFGATTRIGASAAWLTAALAGAWVLLATALRLSDALIWPAFGLVVWAVAEKARSSPGFLAGPLAKHLGSLSIAVMVFYLPTEIAYFHGLDILLGPPEGAGRWLRLCGVFPVILAVAWIAKSGVGIACRRLSRRTRTNGRRAVVGDATP